MGTKEISRGDEDSDRYYTEEISRGEVSVEDFTQNHTKEICKSEGGKREQTGLTQNFARKFAENTTLRGDSNESHRQLEIGRNIAVHTSSEQQKPPPPGFVTSSMENFISCTNLIQDRERGEVNRFETLGFEPPANVRPPPGFEPRKK